MTYDRRSLIDEQKRVSNEYQILDISIFVTTTDFCLLSK